MIVSRSVTGCPTVCDGWVKAPPQRSSDGHGFLAGPALTHKGDRPVKRTPFRGATRVAPEPVTVGTDHACYRYPENTIPHKELELNGFAV